VSHDGKRDEGAADCYETNEQGDEMLFAAV
jgi:hypothetical protein